MKIKNYKENERSIQPTGVYLRRLEWRNMEEQMEIKEMNQTQQLPWLANNILFYYEGEKHTKNESEWKQNFLQHKEKNSNSKEAYTDGSKSTGKKVGYAAIITDTTRRGELPEEASIHTAEMTAMKEIKKKRT